MSRCWWTKGTRSAAISMQLHLHLFLLKRRVEAACEVMSTLSTMECQKRERKISKQLIVLSAIQLTYVRNQPLRETNHGASQLAHNTEWKTLPSSAIITWLAQNATICTALRAGPVQVKRKGTLRRFVAVVPSSPIGYSSLRTTWTRVRTAWQLSAHRSSTFLFSSCSGRSRSSCSCRCSSWVVASRKIRQCPAHLRSGSASCWRFLALL